MDKSNGMSAEMPKMPEPVAWFTSYKGVVVPYTQSLDLACYWKAYGWHVTDLYTADQMRTFAQEATRQAMERECKWTREEDFESDVWHTACGNAFVFTDGGPEENEAKFCCYCGGHLRALSDMPAQEPQP